MHRQLTSKALALPYCFLPNGQPPTVTRLIRATGLRSSSRSP
jgi:hypothetical protein